MGELTFELLDLELELLVELTQGLVGFSVLNSGVFEFRHDRVLVLDVDLVDFCEQSQRRLYYRIAMLLNSARLHAELAQTEVRLANCT